MPAAAQEGTRLSDREITRPLVLPALVWDYYASSDITVFATGPTSTFAIGSLGMSDIELKAVVEKLKTRPFFVSATRMLSEQQKNNLQCQFCQKVINLNEAQFIDGPSVSRSSSRFTGFNEAGDFQILCPAEKCHATISVVVSLED